MWLDDKSVVSKPDLHQVCRDSVFKDSKHVDTPDDILPANKSDIQVNTDVQVPSLDIF